MAKSQKWIVMQLLIGALSLSQLGAEETTVLPGLKGDSEQNLEERLGQIMEELVTLKGMAHNFSAGSLESLEASSSNSLKVSELNQITQKLLQESRDIELKLQELTLAKEQFKQSSEVVLEEAPASSTE